jgi:hypothetical protein
MEDFTQSSIDEEGNSIDNNSNNNNMEHLLEREELMNHVSWTISFYNIETKE